ncbi:hypothetical protein [Burkholderia vietnamiensis]|nr:hypothetical protein [Burkholderia vietnamiensis]UEC04717.1 hypothetical protein LK462_26210 [Burkholderia vietnamiensis]HDR8988597.1 hypothetical protein [Burkholderia vietnamiensis]
MLPSPKTGKIAVLLTGVPRNYERCIEPLRFLLQDREVDYFAVFREEFASAEELAALALQGFKAIVVPIQSTVEAVARFAGKPIAPTVVMMWHELSYGTRQIDNLADYQLVFRTRFDIFFHRQLLPDVIAGDDDVYLPNQMSWSGANDMLCLASPRAFLRYASTYDRLGQIVDERIYVPEVIAARSLAIASLVQNRLDVFFILYRHALFSDLADEELRILALVHPTLSTYKIGSDLDTPEFRAHRIRTIRATIEHELRFPLHAAGNMDANFYPIEVDARDGAVFRWMALHAHLNRAVSPRAKSLSFLVHFRVPEWTLSDFTLHIDGMPVQLAETSTDEYGRVRVEGALQGMQFRRPWSKFGFSSRRVAVPSQIGANPDDHRMLSVAIGAIEIRGEDDAHANSHATSPDVDQRH